MKEQNAVTNEQAREALDRILNFCEEIDNHIPPDETTGYKMLPDYFIVSRYLNEADYRKQEWISVDDRLPEKHKEVLVVCLGNIGTDFIATNGRWYEHDHWFVTHWMPLPQPPKMKGAQDV